MQETTPSYRASRGRVRALFEGHEIADSAAALCRGETWFFPAEDVQTAVLRRNDHTGMTPEGQIAYFTIYRDRMIVEDAAWCVESPADGHEILKGYIAFSPDHVDLQVGDQGTNNAVAPDAGVRNAPPVRVPPHDPPYFEGDPRDVR